MIGNPNHPVVREMEHNWHKIALLLMMKLKLRNVEITSRDISELEEGLGIAIDTRGGEFWVRVVTEEEGMRMAREEGGLPV